MTEFKKDPDYGLLRKKLSVYSWGVFLCVILTLIPFIAVMHGTFSRAALLSIIFIAAVFQFFTQVLCFLRMNTQTAQGRINVMSFLFTGVILLVVIGGSLWIMWSLNYNMLH